MKLILEKKYKRVIRIHWLGKFVIIAKLPNKYYITM